jgi:hypothetical protein
MIDAAPIIDIRWGLVARPDARKGVANVAECDLPGQRKLEVGSQ